MNQNEEALLKESLSEDAFKILKEAEAEANAETLKSSTDPKDRIKKELLYNFISRLKTKPARNQSIKNRNTRMNRNNRNNTKKTINKLTNRVNRYSSLSSTPSKATMKNRLFGLFKSRKPVNLGLSNLRKTIKYKLENNPSVNKIKKNLEREKTMQALYNMRNTNNRYKSAMDGFE